MKIVMMQKEDLFKLVQMEHHGLLWLLTSAEQVGYQVLEIGGILFLEMRVMVHLILQLLMLVMLEYKIIEY